MRAGVWRFYLALTLFVAWVAVLAGMAIQSAESPRVRPLVGAAEK